MNEQDILKKYKLSEQEHDFYYSIIKRTYTSGKTPKLERTMALILDEAGKVTNVGIDVKTESDINYSTNIILIRKALLERLIGDAESYAYTSFEKDIIQKNVSHLNIYGYKIDEWTYTIDSMESYFDANMALLDRNCRKNLWCKNHSRLFLFNN